MKNYLAPIRMFACLTSVMLLLASCNEPASVSAQPLVVRKKFVAQDNRTEPASLSVAGASLGPAPSVGEPKQALTELRPREEPPPIPAPTPVAPTPKPKVAAPPTHMAETAPVPATPIVKSPEPAMVAQTTAFAPKTPVKMPSPQVQRPEGAITATDAQIAALLNIQAPPIYSADGKVDPFEPLLRDDSTQSTAAKLIAKKRDPQSPLEKIDLGQLKLVAIICASSGNRALVEESSGKGYILREGTYVGMNSGKVVGITFDKVLIEEEFETVYGKTITQKKEITLPKPPGEL